MKGKVQTGTRNIHGKIMLIALQNCTVAHGERIIFHPQRGAYHLAIGMDIISAFAGPADLTSFDLTDHSMIPPSVDTGSTEVIDAKQLVYQKIRDGRDDTSSSINLSGLISEVLDNHGDEWLILLDTYELAIAKGNPLSEDILAQLSDLEKTKPTIGHLIRDGLECISTLVSVS